ncbi:Receptor protein-tyrosine kinase [Aphelenchoides fujianensis]|nr:Receptor protein-tyrosine kinase [Aphelenchoides fujianensis]
MEAYAKIKPRHWLGAPRRHLPATMWSNHVQAARGEVRCQSLDIRNTPLGTSSSGGAMRNELECTIIEGDITLSMMTDEGEHGRDITGSILIFQVRGLSSLGRIFPNLRVIGGDSLIMNYALDLRTVGLKKLTVIKNGGVRITENALLCYTRNINWDNMIVGNLRDVILDTGKPLLQCTDQCVVENEDQCHRSPTNELACWNATECQTFCPYHKFENGTFGPGCTDTGEMCHEFCLGGCTEANDPGACHTCRNVEINGICAASCPNGLFEHQSRRCLTKEGCESLRPMSGSISSRDNAEWKAFNGRCHYECPSGYEEGRRSIIIPNNNRSCVKCVGHCPKKCRGDETIDSVGAALKFRDCNIIDGYLEIEIRIGNGANAEKFSEAFGELEELHQHPLLFGVTSLHMFKKLRVIHGQQLYRGTYALVVFDNVNLRELFNLKRQQLRIANGKIQFQNNRLLCYKKIIDFANHVGITDLSDNDVGLNSNGDKAVCDEEPLEVEVSAVYSTGFSIRWTPFNTTDMDYRKFMGYQIWYKKVDKIDPEMSIDEDRSVCGDSWNMQFSDAMSSDEPELHDGETPKITANGGELVSGAGIEANSLYAFYVQTRTVNHPGARNAISKIHFVKTTFGNPDPPRIRVSQARGPDRLEIQWDVPLRPEGVITHYTVQWAIPPPNEHQEKINACSDEVQKRPSETVSKKSSSAKLGTCSAQEGCCDCSLVPKSAEEEDEDQSRPNEYITEEMELAREERAAFENQIQNKVFVQRNTSERMPEYGRGGRRPKRQTRRGFARDILNYTQVAYNISYLNVSDPEFPEEFRTAGKTNVTGTSFLLAGLPHFTEYMISIFACQDVTATDNQCSSRPAWVTIRTSAIPENDLVPAETVRPLNATDGKEDDRRLHWSPPANPNGPVLAYRAKLFRDDVDTTPLFKCVNITEFNDEEGITFHGIGRRLLNNAFMTTRTMIMLGTGLLILLAILGIVGYYGMNHFLGHKFEEYYWRQTISANPEYLSQIDVYKKDEWELQRDDVQLLDEIGRGTFGQVYRGRGRNVRSACGVVFGECAVKTMPETSTNRERLHFLIEASVMKQFNTSFIVKLFGVVSDQPVLVVMEMMAKGNLRDFLRAHRPDAEENVNQYPLPDPDKYFTWAAQIADGMAYLESIKYNLMRACWRYDPRERPNFYQIVDHLAPNCTPEFRKDSFVVNLTAAERTPEPYNFDVEWADETTNSDGIPFDGEDEELADMSDEPDKVPLDALSIESHQSGEYSDSCSCSTYSDTATTAEHDVHPPRTVGNTHRQILDFLNSARHSQTDMDREKHYDRELLLPAGNSNREDEYVMQDPRPQQVVPPFRPQGPNAQLSIGDADDLLNPIHESQSDPRLRREFSQESEHQGSPHSFKNPSSSTSFSAHNPADWP